jgi:hypothetical protein
MGQHLNELVRRYLPFYDIASHPHRDQQHGQRGPADRPRDSQLAESHARHSTAHEKPRHEGGQYYNRVAGEGLAGGIAKLWRKRQFLIHKQVPITTTAIRAATRYGNNCCWYDCEGLSSSLRSFRYFSILAINSGSTSRACISCSHAPDALQRDPFRVVRLFGTGKVSGGLELFYQRNNYPKYYGSECSED